MTPNAYLCAHCDHHENHHQPYGCTAHVTGRSEHWRCECATFTPGNCPVCAGFGCQACFQDAKGRKR